MVTGTALRRGDRHELAHPCGERLGHSGRLGHDPGSVASAGRARAIHAPSDRGEHEVTLRLVALLARRDEPLFQRLRHPEGEGSIRPLLTMMCGALTVKCTAHQGSESDHTTRWERWDIAGEAVGSSSEPTAQIPPRGASRRPSPPGSGPDRRGTRQGRGAGRGAARGIEPPQDFIAGSSRWRQAAVGFRLSRALAPGGCERVRAANLGLDVVRKRYEGRHRAPSTPSRASRW